MKLSNIFTSSRLVLAPIIYVLYFLPDWIPFISPKITILIIIPIFIFMEFTDFLDGYYARLHNQVDDFGKIFDPFADVVANITVLFCFLMNGFSQYRKISILRCNSANYKSSNVIIYFILQSSFSY